MNLVSQIICCHIFFGKLNAQHNLSFQIKEWAKAQKINDPKSGSLNSYSLCLLVLFHFQVLFLMSISLIVLDLFMVSLNVLLILALFTSNFLDIGATNSTTSEGDL